MKTLFTLLAFVLSFNLIVAQPIVNADILLNIGDERLVNYADVDFNPGDAGENVTWDFSGLSPSYDVTWFAVDPEETGFADQFPEADIAFIIPGDESEDEFSDGWVFYDTGSGNEISLLGSILFNHKDSDIDTNNFYLNDDPDKLFQFPMTYQDQFADDIAGTNIVYYQNQLFEVERTGSTTTEVDGYGTLMTPYGTFSNVIRVKRTEDIADVYLTIVTYQEIERYDWYSPDYDYLLYHTEEIVIKDAGGNEQNRTTQTYYAEPHLITGISKNTIESFETYPNPCSDIVYLPVDLVKNSVKVELFDLQGSLLYFDRNQKVDIDVSDLNEGVYVVLITGKNEIYHRSRIVIN